MCSSDATDHCRLLLAVLLAVTVAAGSADDTSSEPWSRSLPNGVVEGFPVTAHHLLIAQESSTNTLYAFSLLDGTPQWTQSAIGEELFPFVLPAKERDQDPSPSPPHHFGIAVLQGTYSMIAIDLMTGEVMWRLLGGFSAPVFLPVRGLPPPQGGEPDHLLTSHRDMTSTSGNPRCVTAVDFLSGNISMQHCEHVLCGDPLVDGAVLPVVVTDQTFLGCFEVQAGNISTRNIVLEIPMRDKGIAPHIFDFHPLSVMIAPNVPFITKHHDNGHRQPFREKEGEPIRVAFAVAAWDTQRKIFHGNAEVVSVIAQAGIISWRRVFHLASFENPSIDISFNRLMRDKSRPHEVVVSNGFSFVVSLHTDTGNVAWNVSLPATASSGSTNHLGTISHMVETEHHVIFARPVLPSIRRWLVPMEPLFAASKESEITVLDVNTGSVLHRSSSDGVRANILCHRNQLYLPTLRAVVTMNISDCTLKTLVYTNAPVFRLEREVRSDRVVFGTSYSVFSFPLA